jgi:hypothetical protein
MHTSLHTYACTRPCTHMHAPMQFKRREDTQALETKRLQSEIKVQKARISSLEVSLDASRKKLDEAKDVLDRKRSKKRRCVWIRSMQPFFFVLPGVWCMGTRGAPSVSAANSRCVRSSCPCCHLFLVTEAAKSRYS